MAQRQHAQAAQVGARAQTELQQRLVATGAADLGAQATRTMQQLARQTQAAVAAAAGLAKARKMAARE